MKVIALQYQGVRKLVPAGDVSKLNELKRLGYKPVIKNGSVEIIETSVQTSYAGILDKDIQEALLKSEKTEEVKKTKNQ